MTFSRSALESDLSAIIGSALAKQIVGSYVEMQQRYTAGDWLPTELDGGHFCEAVARAIYRVDTSMDTTDLPGRIADNLLDRNRTPGSHTLSKTDRDHFCRVLQTVYKFRSDRGVAHISSTYTANFIDATLVLTAVKWMFSEFLRLSWNSDRGQVAKVIQAITQLEHPLIHELDGKPLVLSTKLSAPEEILFLLSRSAGGSLTSDELRSYVRHSMSAVNTAITRLIASREVRKSDAGEIVITSNGEKRVSNAILPKLEDNSTPKAPSRKAPRKKKARAS
ncbi:MAG TPA: hypothetical protein VF040_22570 [Ktedonobacterales bacterium]